jgi:regulator of replication initiation timing
MELKRATEELSNSRSSDRLFQVQNVQKKPIVMDNVNANDELQGVADKLAIAGFQPLHPSLLYAEPSPTNSLSVRQVSALKDTLESILKEYERRGEIIQGLITRSSDAEERAYTWEKKANEEREKIKNSLVDYDRVQLLHDKLESARHEIGELTTSLGIARTENAELQTKLISLRRQVAEDELPDIKKDDEPPIILNRTDSAVNDLYEKRIELLKKEIVELKYG